MKAKILPFLVMIMLGAATLTSEGQTPVNPVKPALLVIDIQNAFLQMVPDAER